MSKFSLSKRKEIRHLKMSNYVEFAAPFAIGGHLEIDTILNQIAFEESIKPPITRLLPYNDVPYLKYNTLDDYTELQFIYINRDLWEI